MAYISDHELRAQKLQEAAETLHNLRAKSRDGSEPNSARSRRRRQTFDNDPSNDSRPSSARSSASSRKSRMSMVERPIMLETDHPELFLAPPSRGHPHKILPANWDEPDNAHAQLHGGHVVPRSVPTTPRNGITPRSCIKLEPLPNRTPRNGKSFDSNIPLFTSSSQSPSQSSLGIFSPQETPQQSMKSGRGASSKKASISISTAQLTTFQRVYSNSKISQGVGSSEKKYGQLAEEAIAGLGLQEKEMNLLKTSFAVFDEDKSGEIDNLEFLHALGETDKQGEVSNPFIDKFFQMIDVDRIERDSDGGMNFEEFLVMSATFLMFTHIDMVRFVFECHNKAGSGCFGPQDFVDLSKQINAVVVNGGPKDWIATRDKYDKIGKGYLIEAEFIQMSKDYPQLIYFASRIQLKLQNLTLGEPFYHKLLQRQHRARMTEEYMKTHDGKPPPESMINIWLRKFTICFSVDTYDVRINDNTQLLNLGRIMFDRNFSIQKPMVLPKQKSFKNAIPSPSKRPKSARKSIG